jgi:hypothetical protein
MHSTESGRFLPCARHEVERLIAAAKRGELDDLLMMRTTSFIADGSADFTQATAAGQGGQFIERGTGTGTLGVDPS